MSENISYYTSQHHKSHMGLFGGFLCALMVILLCFSEVTLQTSLIFNRELSISPWIFRIGALTPADYWLIATTIYVISQYLLKLRFPNDKFKNVVNVLLLYLFIGFFYNVFVVESWKTYLYDIKAVLYIVIPYYLLKVTNAEKFSKYIQPKYILLYCTIAAVVDTGFVYLIAAPEYPEFLGIPAYATVFDVGAIFLWVLITKNNFFRLLLIGLFLIEIIGLVNKLSLTPLFGLAYSFFYYLALKHSSIKRKIFFSMITFIAFQIIAPIVLLFSPISLMSEKADGVITRTIQWNNFVDNALENFPIIIGKGIGSTYFEHHATPASDIYAVGTSMGEDVEYSMTLPIKFIYNFLPAGIMHKFGFLGLFLLLFYICKSCIYNKNYMYKQVYPGSAVLVLFLMFYYVTYIGFLRPAVITSIFLYWHHSTRTSDDFERYW